MGTMPPLNLHNASPYEMELQAKIELMKKEIELKNLQREIDNFDIISQSSFMEPSERMSEAMRPQDIIQMNGEKIYEHSQA